MYGDVLCILVINNEKGAIYKTIIIWLFKVLFCMVMKSGFRFCALACDVSIVVQITIYHYICLYYYFSECTDGFCFCNYSHDNEVVLLFIQYL